MGRKHSEKTKMKISQANKGKPSWAKGKTLSLEHRKNLSNARKLYFKKNPNAMDGKNNPNFGKKFSKEYRKKLSDSHKGISSGMKGKNHSKETKEKISITKEGYIPWNKGKSTPVEVRKKQSKVALGRKPSQEARKNMSIAQNKRIKEGKRIIFRNKNFISGNFYSLKNKKTIHYRSSYELRAYELLEVDSKVKNYCVEPFAIEYKINETIKLYIPDILIYYKNGDKKLVEVKPSRRLNEQINQKKIIAAKEYCKDNDIKFSLWTEEKLFKELSC